VGPGSARPRNWSPSRITPPYYIINQRIRCVHAHYIFSYNSLQLAAFRTNRWALADWAVRDTAMRSPRSSRRLHSLVLPWWDSILRQHSISLLDLLSSPPNCFLQSLVSFFAWLAWHNPLLTSRVFAWGMPFDIHIQGCRMRSRDIACPGKSALSVSADGTDWVSPGCMVDQRMDPI